MNLVVVIDLAGLAPWCCIDQGQDPNAEVPDDSLVKASISGR